MDAGQGDGDPACRRGRHRRADRQAGRGADVPRQSGARLAAEHHAVSAQDRLSDAVRRLQSHPKSRGRNGSRTAIFRRSCRWPTMRCSLMRATAASRRSSRDRWVSEHPPAGAARIGRTRSMEPIQACGILASGGVAWETLDVAPNDRTPGTLIAQPGSHHRVATRGAFHQHHRRRLSLDDRELSDVSARPAPRRAPRHAADQRAPRACGHHRAFRHGNAPSEAPDESRRDTREKSPCV